MTKRLRNPGWFKSGHDPRRHDFTNEERRRGCQTTWRKLMADSPWMLDWLQRRISTTAHASTLMAYQQRKRCA
jgi:hypothetical protein